MSQEEHDDQTAQEVAAGIIQVGAMAHIAGLYDKIDYIRQTARETIDRASQYEAAFILGNMNPETADRIRTEGRTLLALADFLEGQKAVSAARDREKDYTEHRDNIDRLFR